MCFKMFFDLCLMLKFFIFILNVVFGVKYGVFRDSSYVAIAFRSLFLFGVEFYVFKIVLINSVCDVIVCVVCLFGSLMY